MVVKHLQQLVSGRDYRPHKFQAPVSFRVVPQIQSACSDALRDLRQGIEGCFCSYFDNPILVENHRHEASLVMFTTRSGRH